MTLRLTRIILFLYLLYFKYFSKKKMGSCPNVFLNLNIWNAKLLFKSMPKGLYMGSYYAIATNRGLESHLRIIRG